jgi:hypothetical protein
VLNEEEGVATAGALRVFERVAAPEHGVEHRRHTDRWDLAAIARNPATVTR